MSTYPKWFRPVSVVALLWNLLGCMAYLADVTVSPERLSEMTAAQQALYASRPWWAVAATATAVWFGAAGCLGLILRRKWSVWLLLISLAGVVVQDIWLFGLSGAASEGGGVAFIMQGLVLVISIGLVILASRALTRGWLF